jgi:hypothetical protein
MTPFDATLILVTGFALGYLAAEARRREEDRDD